MGTVIGDSDDYSDDCRKICGRSIAPDLIWHDEKWIEYNFFSNGKDLVPLIEDVIKYLK